MDRYYLALYRAYAVSYVSEITTALIKVSATTNACIRFRKEFNMNKLLALLICSLITCPNQGRADTLPTPTGEYHVGVTYLAFVDNDRLELFDNSQESNREITVKAWYPSDNTSDPEPYLLPAEVEIATKYFQFPEIYKSLETNASRDVPVSSKKEQYPVLIFSHGFGEHYSQNSILMEELASHGYIVFSISHHYECKFSSFPDGRVIYIDMKSQRFQTIMLEQQNPKAMALLQQMYNATNDEERKKALMETSNTLPTILTESPKYWAEDIAFLIDGMEDIAGANMIFKGRLEIDRIGIFGMSLGGLASSEICLTDKRVKAGISLDGGLYGTLIERELEIPFMYLNSKRFLGYGNIFTSQSKKDCYSLSVENSDHYNLSDYSIYPIPPIGFLLGKIDGKRTIEIMNVMVLAFFEKYLNDRDDIDIVELAKQYPEIEIATNR
jgi:predicted dienelactone hydrolase